MDIEKVKKVLKELEEIYGSPNPFKDDKDYDRAVAIKTVLNELDNKDKEIKEKIEWLREISDNGANAVRFAATHDDEIERMQKQKDISTMIGILQELLRESD